jgi:hypothetical protein
MRKLGEQWIDKDGNMQKCIWTDGNAYTTKDLGPVNEDGCLPCPFCGEYPNLESNGWYFWYCCTNDDCLAEVGAGKTKQEAIDIWNRRA